ncbi:hypothetical protein JTB14_002533 [Gonioctena quinquepunctata]|nr:hypothetical protein JTB14_002533 [Gonioctena quinquepunctata]
MEMGVRVLPKKRKFDPSELEDSAPQTAYIPVSVVQCTSIMSAPQATAVDYSCPQRVTQADEMYEQKNCKQNIDLSEWCDHRVLSKQGDWYYPGVIREAKGSNVDKNEFIKRKHYCRNGTGRFQKPCCKIWQLKFLKGKNEMARNELKEPTSKSDALGAEANCLTFDFPACNSVEQNDYNNGSSSSEPQIITNLETVLISSIPHFADLSEQRTNTDLPEQLVTGEHIVPKSLHPLIQLEKDAVTSFLEK